MLDGRQVYVSSHSVPGRVDVISDLSELVVFELSAFDDVQCARETYHPLSDRLSVERWLQKRHRVCVYERLHGHHHTGTGDVRPATVCALDARTLYYQRKQPRNSDALLRTLNLFQSIVQSILVLNLAGFYTFFFLFSCIKVAKYLRGEGLREFSRKTSA